MLHLAFALLVPAAHAEEPSERDALVEDATAEAWLDEADARTAEAAMTPWWTCAECKVALVDETWGVFQFTYSEKSRTSIADARASLLRVVQDRVAAGTHTLPPGYTATQWVAIAAVCAETPQYMHFAPRNQWCEAENAHSDLEPAGL